MIGEWLPTTTLRVPQVSALCHWLSRRKPSLLFSQRADVESRCVPYTPCWIDLRLLSGCAESGKRDGTGTDPAVHEEKSNPASIGNAQTVGLGNLQTSPNVLHALAC
jgi:hypothetical protein